MTEILHEPEGPGAAFLKGAGMLAGSMFGPMVVLVIVAVRQHGGLWSALGVATAITAASAFLAGALFALWALVRRWAYQRYISGPF